MQGDIILIDCGEFVILITKNRFENKIAFYFLTMFLKNLVRRFSCVTLSECNCLSAIGFRKRKLKSLATNSIVHFTTSNDYRYCITHSINEMTEMQ